MDDLDYKASEEGYNTDIKQPDTNNKNCPSEQHSCKDSFISSLGLLNADEESFQPSVKHQDDLSQNISSKDSDPVQKENDNIETNDIKEETFIDDQNINFVPDAEIVAEDDCTLDLEVTTNDILSIQPNDVESDTLMDENSEVDSVLALFDDKKTLVMGTEDNVNLNNGQLTDSHFNHKRETHEKELTEVDIEETYTVEDSERLPHHSADNLPDTCTGANTDRISHKDHDQLLPIPLFDHIDDETDCCDSGLHIDRQNILLQIPNFNLLQCDDTETAVNSDYENFDVVQLLQEIKNDLERRNDNSVDLGLTELFEEPNSNKKHATSVKSRSAKKRKKQQLKLRKPLLPSQNTDNVRRKFAQSFQELQSSKMEFHDYNIDSKYTCPVCLEMYHMPNVCNPCCHMFCDPCLRRMTGQGYEGVPCPLCRTVIASCQLDKDFDEKLLLEYPDIYTARAMSERKTKFRHYRLPYTAPVPLGKRLMRQLIASRNIQSDTRWMSHDWFKFLLGCTVGMCISLLIMLFNHVKSVRDARDVNIVFLSVLVGMSVTFLIFKHIKI